MGDREKIVVFGAGGFIGTALSKNLVSDRRSVVGYSLNSCPEDIDFFQYYERNLLEDKDILDAIAGATCIVYLISSTTPSSSMSEISKAYADDILMLTKVLDAAKAAGIQRIIFASSGGTVYGQSSKPNKEGDPTHPICHYGISKLTCENLLLMYNQLYEMENVILRISNPFGFGQKPEKGVGVITAFANSAKQNKTIKIIGDGSNVRDMISIDYVVGAFRLAIDWSFDKNIVPIFNIGSGKGISILEILKTVEEIFGNSIEVKKLPNRSFDVGYSVLDISKSMQCFGYKPPKNIKIEIRKYITAIKEA